MDQGAAETTGAHGARLLLILFGAVLGFLALSFFLGSSSASADDGTDAALGDLVSSVTEPVSATVAGITETPAAAASTAVADLVDPVVDALPIDLEPIVAPVTELVDTTLSHVGGVVAPVTARAFPGLAPAVATLSLDAAAASTPVAAPAAAAIEGVAAGALGYPAAGISTDPPTSATPAGSTALFAIAASIGFLALLVMRRRTPAVRTMPGSPVDDTDSSPD